MPRQLGPFSSTSGVVGVEVTLLVLFVILSLMIAPRYIQRLQERGPYSAAPECPPGQHNTTAPTECRLITQATVVQRWYRKGRNGIALAQVETADHNSFEVSFPYDDIVS